MSKIGWFLVGAAVGVVALSQYRDNPRVAEAIDESTKAVDEFRQAVVSGFREREAELKADQESQS